MKNTSNKKLLAELVVGVLSLVAVVFQAEEGRADDKLALVEKKATAAKTSPRSVYVVITDQGLEPEVVRVEPGTTIIWENSSAQSVRVLFPEKPISTICKAPRGFVVGSKGIQVSEQISDGDVASVCPLQSASYRYQIEYLGESGAESQATPSIAEGNIHVSQLQ